MKMIPVRSRVVLAAAAGALFIGAAASVANASLIGFASGNTNPYDVTQNGGNAIDGTVNFAIFDHSGATAGDSFGTGLAGFDSLFSNSVNTGTLAGAGFSTSSTYLYLYQAVNNGSNTLEMSQFTIGLLGTNSWNSSLVTSFGYFTGAGFKDNSGAITTSNVLGGPDSPFTVFSNRDPASFGVTGGGAISITGGVAPTALSIDGSSFKVTYGGLNLTSGQIALLVGFTSDAPPVLAGVSIQDGSTNGGGTAIQPGPAQETILPEPASMLVWSLGLGLATVAGFRRGRNAKRGAV
jgi:hypothetical protein